MRTILFLGGLAAATAAMPALAQTAPFAMDDITEMATDFATSAGIVWGDFNGDGLHDVVVARMFHDHNALYPNRGDAMIAPDGSSHGLAHGGSSSGAAAADFDNDGDLDLAFANQAGEDNFLYINDGTGQFEFAAGSPVTCDHGESYAASWADYDNDGLADLFITNRSNQADFLYRNTGSGFERVTGNALTDTEADSFSAAWGDYDNDGDVDVFVADFTSAGASRLYRNDGQGGFEAVDVAGLTDLPSVDAGGSWGDFDNDGDLDLFVSAGGFFEAGESPSRVYENLGGGRFAALGASRFDGEPGSGGGSVWFDFDNDGDLDLYQAIYRENDRLYVNDGAGRLERLEEPGILTFAGYSVGVAAADYNEDGLVDLAISYWQGQADRIFRNGLQEAGTALLIDLQGVASNRSALGARIHVESGGVTQIREISSQSGARSQSAYRQHFGLGAAEAATQVRIVWPSGTEDVLTDITSGQIIAVREGDGLVSARPLAGGALPILYQLYGVLSSDGPEAYLAAVRERLTAGDPFTAREFVMLAGAAIPDPAARAEVLAEGLELFPQSARIPFAAAELARAAGEGNAAELYAMALGRLGNDAGIGDGEAAFILLIAARGAE